MALILLLQAATCEEFAWSEAAPIPAERVHCIPGWTVGPYFYCQERGSLDSWVTRQGKEGQLAPWVLVKNSGFTDSKWSNPVVSVGPRVYAFGHWGQARTAALDPSAGGLLGKWKPAMKEQGMGGTKEPLVWGGGTSAEVNRVRYLYHVGGFEYEGPNFTRPRSQRKVFYARINPDGFLTDWVQTTPLPYHPMGASAVFHEGSIYVFGGCAGRFDTGDPFVGMADVIYRSAVRPDGTLGPWTRLGRSLPYKACGIAAFVRGGRLYVMGGETSGDGAGTATAFTDRCARARLSEGELEEWETLPALPAPTGKTPHGFIGSWFYIVGLAMGGKTPVYRVKVAP